MANTNLQPTIITKNIIAETNSDVKLSILMIKSKLNKVEVEKLLKKNKDYVKKAIENITI